jgi:hypothetical protein
MKGLTVTVAMTKVQRIDALRSALDKLVGCVACDNPDAAPSERTYRLEGWVHEAVGEANKLLAEEDDRAEARRQKDERKAQREAASDRLHAENVAKVAAEYGVDK